MPSWISTFIFANQNVLTMVTDPWPPYIIQENNTVSVNDVGIARAAFKNTQHRC